MYKYKIPPFASGFFLPEILLRSNYRALSKPPRGNQPCAEGTDALKLLLALDPHRQK